MPQPTVRSLHVDANLTNLSIGYSNAEYIADKCFPLVRVRKQSDIVPKYDQSLWFRDTASLRAPGTKSRGHGWTVDTSDTYFCNRYSFRDEINDQQRANADAPWNLDQDATTFVTDKAQMRREVSFAADFFTTGVWTGDVAGATNFTKWSSYGSSTPLVDLELYKDTVEARIGREPNCLVLGKQVWLQLKWHPDIIDTIKYTQRGVVSEELFASLAGFPKVCIGRAIYTTTAEGTAEASITYSRIWGKHALQLYVPAAPSLRTPAAGYTFVWQEVPNADQWIKRMRDEEREVDIIEVNTNFDQKKTAAGAGQFMENCVA